MDANHVQQLKDEAKRQWAKAGHPGWSIIGAVGQEEQVCALSHVSILNSKLMNPAMCLELVTLCCDQLGQMVSVVLYYFAPAHSLHSVSITLMPMLMLCRISLPACRLPATVPLQHLRGDLAWTWSQRV